MERTAVVIVGAGQAGLAVSYLLTAASVDHVILERGQVAESWRSRRWDSLRLLTPNWMSRLPGWSYRGSDPAGFMPAQEVTAYLGRYASSFDAPVFTGTTVLSVRAGGRGFVVDTDSDSWSADAVVVATGYADEPAVPGYAHALHPSVRQLTPDSYRNPGSVPDGGVLIVGASASGVQLADELAGAGREVTLAVGRHTRMVRRYRGMDIMCWLDSMGSLDQPLRPSKNRAPEPSLQLVGSTDRRSVDLPSLATRGVRLTGRVSGLDSRTVTLAGDLALTTAAADAKLDRLLLRIDDFATRTGMDREIDPPTHLAPSVPEHGSRETTLTTLHLRGIGSVIWATGYRRRYPWLQLPVLDAYGEIRQQAGRTTVPGLVVVGMQRQTRRSSSFIDGVRHDAALVVDHLVSEILLAPGTCRRAS
jgi:putative flavoprotein involved in K+ transport